MRSASGTRGMRQVARALCFAVAATVAAWLGCVPMSIAAVDAAPEVPGATKMHSQLALPFMQTKSTTDLTISHVEVTQVVQRWGDVAPLIHLVRGKPTV